MIDESGQSSGFGVVAQTDTITAIKKALETLSHPKSMSMFVSQGDMLSHLMKERKMAVAALESLQRENEELRQGKDHIAAEKAGIAKNAHSNVDYWKAQYETAESEVKRLRQKLEPFAAQSALSSTGDTHGN